MPCSAPTPHSVGPVAVLALMTALSNLLNHPVISGFVSGASTLIIFGQIGPLLRVYSSGATTVQLLFGTMEEIPAISPATTAMGLTSMAGTFLGAIP